MRIKLRCEGGGEAGMIEGCFDGLWLPMCAKVGGFCWGDEMGATEWA